MSREFVVVDRIAPHLLLLGEDIAVFSDGIQFAALVVAAAVGIEVVALRIPDIRMAEIVGVVGRQVVDHRIAREVVLLTADLHPIHTDHRAVVGIVVTAVRFELVFAVGHHAPVGEFTDVGLGVEKEFVGVERRVAVDHLHQIGVDVGHVRLAVVVGAVAVDVGVVLVDEHVAETLHVLLAVTHGAVAGDDRTAVVEGDVADQTDGRRIPKLDRVHHVGFQVDDLLFGLCRTAAARPGEHRRANGQQYERYGQESSQTDDCFKKRAGPPHSFTGRSAGAPAGFAAEPPSLFYPMFVGELPVAELGIDVDVHAVDLLGEPLPRKPSPACG